MITFIEKLLELPKTTEGAIALFGFLFAGCIVGGIVMCALTSSTFWEILLNGKKCKKCKKRSKDWIQWHSHGEKDYDGYDWCPVCDHKQYEGFSDRCF